MPALEGLTYMRRPVTKIKAFTLIELMVVVALVAGMMSVSIIGLRSIMGVDIKHEISRIAGLISETYSLAIISGKTHRIVFNLDTNSFFVEEKTGDSENIMPELGYEEESKLDEKLKKFRPAFTKVSGLLGETNKLKSGAKFAGLWVEKMPEIVRANQAYIYFFSDGYSQLALVSISEENNESNSISLILQPLTGTVSIQMGEPQTSELSNEP